MPYGDGNPQLKDGFSRIANEILDALALTNLSDHESRCIHLLWRKTYGWQDTKTNQTKKEDVVAYSQWATGTGIDKRSIRRALQNLVGRHIFTKKLVKVPGRNPLIIWAFQKNYGKWNGYRPVFQMQLGDGTPPPSHDVGAVPPSPTDQVGDTEPSPSYEVGTEVEEVGSPAPPEVGSPAPPTKDSKDITTKDTLIKKKTYGEFQNVFLSDNEYNKLCSKFSTGGANERIEHISTGIESKGYKYKSHYAAILSWDRKDKKENSHGANKGHTETSTDELKKSADKSIPFD